MASSLLRSCQKGVANEPATPLRAILVSDRRFHIGFVAAALVYQISFILRLFDTIV
ncbi:hypothetical protein MES4922_20091 [Mesorhizobium ventifaucium]|uniref:MFS transporter n=1 Tax=Mesorhizobium ventifaucium TaxID=666020 RepID=A0ABN8JJU9_9HYPH|nr:hypothetical protein MES4922_20091 [Mesorhizobium ventifaucium]